MIYTLTLNPSLDRELVVPEIEFGQVLRASDVRVDHGGKGVNVSRMLAALNVESVAMGFAGGAAGERLQEGIAALGIRTDFVEVQGETRTNVSIVSADRRRHLKVNEPGPAVTAAERAALRQRVRARARSGDIWVMAGSLAPGVPPTFYADLIRDVQPAGSRAILDTSGEALRLGCAMKPFLVKPNRTEAEELHPTPVLTLEDAVAAGRMLTGPQNVVVSMGSLGAALVGDGEAWTISAPRVLERNAVGAGDSLVAGLAYGLAREYPLREALRWGIACGAATAALPGTAVGSRADVLEFLGRVREPTQVT